jgi:hypothetical protein
LALKLILDFNKAREGTSTAEEIQEQVRKELGITTPAPAPAPAAPGNPLDIVKPLAVVSGLAGGAGGLTSSLPIVGDLAGATGGLTSSLPVGNFLGSKRREASLNERALDLITGTLGSFTIIGDLVKRGGVFGAKRDEALLKA